MTSSFPVVSVSLSGETASARSRISEKYSSMVLNCLRVIWILTSPLPSFAAGRKRTRATARLRRPVPHHQPCLSAGFGSGRTRVWISAGPASATVSPASSGLVMVVSYPAMGLLSFSYLSASTNLGTPGTALDRGDYFGGLQGRWVHASVGVIGSVVDFEFFEHLATQAAFGEHSADGFGDEEV